MIKYIDISIKYIKQTSSKVISALMQGLLNEDIGFCTRNLYEFI